jgi:hypothetical protein
MNFKQTVWPFLVVAGLGLIVIPRVQEISKAGTSLSERGLRIWAEMGMPDMQSLEETGLLISLMFLAVGYIMGKLF